MSKCGTPNGPQEHRQRGEQPCPDCRKAAADYMREYRIRKAVERDPEGELRRAKEAAAAALERLRWVKEEYAEVKR